MAMKTEGTILWTKYNYKKREVMYRYQRLRKGCAVIKERQIKLPRQTSSPDVPWTGIRLKLDRLRLCMVYFCTL